MSSPDRQQNSEIWNKLTPDAQAITLWLGPLTATSADSEFLEHMARASVEDLQGYKINLYKGLAELHQFGIIEKITYLDELRETMKKFQPVRDIYDPLKSPELTDNERKYLRAKHDLERYERDPESSKAWTEPKFRLKADFKQYAIKQWEDKLGLSF